MKNTYWNKTDNSGMLYPLIMTLSAQSNFEISVLLTSNVDYDKLKQALIKSYQRFPNFKVELLNNLFRATLVENNNEVIVHQDKQKLIGRIDFKKNNNYLIEVSYFNKEIHLKFFHALTDGNGALVFTKYLLTQYAILLGVNVEQNFNTPCPGEDENAYQKYLDKNIDKKGLIGGAKSTALQVKGSFFKRDGFAAITGEISTKKVLDVCHQYNCSLTVLLGAVAMLATNEIYGDGKKSPTLFVPVNLRKYFKSNTMSNFVSSAKCVLPPSICDLEDTVAQLKQSLNCELQDQNLKKALYLASTVANNPVLRFMPLFLKRMFITFGRELVSSTTQTMILSNVGKIDLPQEVLPLVENVYFYLNCNRRTPLNLAVSSYNDMLTISFTRHISEKNVEKLFFQKMRDLGLDFEIQSNYREFVK